MNKKFRSNTGFTLIEIIIAIAVTSALLLMGIPLTTDWIDSTQVNNAAANLKSAAAQAKSAALRNSKNITMGSVANSLCFDATTQKLTVVHGTCATASTADLIFTYSIANGVSIKTGGNNFECISFDSAGLVIPSADCASDTINFEIGKRNEHTTVDVS